MGKRIDLTGQKFGRLLVLGEAPKRGGQTYWLCECSCENHTRKEIRGSHLREGKILSCGCYNKDLVHEIRHKSLVGQKFGKLTVEEAVGTTKTGEYIYSCKCECGNTTRVFAGNLTSGNTSSCGCYQKEVVREMASKMSKGRYKDLAGLTKGKLTAIEIVRVENGIPIWKCQCECGNTIEVRRDYFVDGVVKSCGCLKSESQYKDLVGQHFGDLEVLSLDGRRNKHTYWNCLCHRCGKEKAIETSHLVYMKTCGCNHIANYGSAGELDVKAIVENYYSTKKVRILGGKEIDIYIPELKLGIEYNGSAYHASLGGVYSDKSRFYHRDKFLLAKEKGIHLISLFDVDWSNNRVRIENYLRHLLSPKRKIFARKCELAKLPNDIAYDFVDKWHLQGANKSAMKINYGLYYKGGKFKNLIAVMSFGKPRLKKQEGKEYELHRYCVADNYTIIGGAERLLHQFEIEYGPDRIISYSDNDYFVGNIYSRLGFTNVGQCTPRYYWYRGGNCLSREQCQLEKLREREPELLEEAYRNEAPNKEDYVMLSLGYCKVYRSGNTKWVKGE